MEFEWDAEKSRQNVRKHGIDFAAAKTIWASDVLVYKSRRSHHGEIRWLAIGDLDGELITVVFTWRGELRRLISARKARPNEQKDYENEIGRRT